MSLTTSLTPSENRFFGRIGIHIRSDDIENLYKKTLEIGSNSGIFIKHFPNDKSIAVEPCDNFAEFTQELEEWGVYGCAKIDFDDPDLDIAKLDRFIKAENGYIREVA